ncbi:CBS domain-containing protein [Haloplanus natans]|uniref:CBS domain-containing protein n=1 Tax=Haloplanus natans TaxID=376171 RepID=UPI000677DB21|nr:CBS domain-containing protein [Haloplanus natans]
MSLTARDLMETDVQTVAPDDEVSEVLGRLARADFNGFPVVDGVEHGSTDDPTGAGDDGTVVGIVTQHDLVHLFQTEDRTLWLPIGLPPFTQTLTYAIDVSWDDLDLGVDLAKNANRPISEVMTTDVVTVTPDADLDTILDLLADDDRDINRLPVVEREERGSSESRPEADDDGRLVGIVARQDVLRAIRDRRRESKR